MGINIATIAAAAASAAAALPSLLTVRLRREAGTGAEKKLSSVCETMYTRQTGRTRNRAQYTKKE